MSILSNPITKQYNYVSRYSGLTSYYHSLDDKYIMEKPSWLDSNTPYVSHTVKRGDTYDKLALHYYNNPTLYWIILSYNHISDPFTEPKEGSTIQIPTFTSIEFTE